MDLSSAIDWWDEWKLRILVLCSLFVQSFLLFSMYVRTVYALRRLRVLVWIAYIGGDALAIYALATLFNRQKQHTAADGGGTISVIWAPVLLIHLGGQPTISAYSLEDNELWRRHIITLVSQVTVALYVFCKWWSGEKRLLLVAIFLFIIGILKFSQKPWALRRASYANITSTYLSSPSRRVEGSCCARFCTGDICDIAGQLEDNPVGNDDDIDYSLEEYVEKAQEHVKEPKADGGLVLTDIYRMFVDLAVPYSFRLRHLQWFINLDKQSNTQHLVLQLGKNGVMIHHHVLRGLINVQFLTIYTRMRSSLTCLGSYTNLVVSSLDIASVVLFAKSNKDGYNKSDISVTYILLFGRIVMENSISLFSLLSLPFILCFPALREILSWQDMVAQHNIMSFCARRKKPPTLMKLATFSNLLRDYINKYWYIRYQSVAQHICVLVRRHVEEDGWKKYICDPAMYRRFNNLRGEHTLKNHHLLEELEWTFNLPFDEYVLVWHIATDLCIHQTTDICIHQTTDDASASEDAISSRDSSEIISNYMIYLLFICPEMLIPGARQDLFIHACDAIEHIIKDQTQVSPLLIAKKVYSCMGGDDRGVIYKACKLAKALIDLNNDTETWEVIQGVWVEMLCYSASRCRGYLHAKSLGVAGQFLTCVWLLWWCMGMQTLPDMMHQLGPTLERSQTNKCTQPDKQEEELTLVASV